MRKFGLIGHPLAHSFSHRYFTKKFRQEGLSFCEYNNYDLPTITDFPKLIEKEGTLNGLNVTIPYKEQIIPYLDQLVGAAAEIKAVNTIQFKDGKMMGFNTDVIGFKNALQPLLQPSIFYQALVLGTGGASKAIAYVLKELGIPFKKVSRKTLAEGFTYLQIDETLLKDYRLVINTTPLGTFPKVAEAPLLPYAAVGHQHILFDLVYNPEETLFMKKGRRQGAQVKNGYEMLVGQAEASWKIWNAG